eukprot:2317057-Pyramimonas_sp.AAC.1
MISGKLVADPVLIMKHKSNTWANKWTATAHRQAPLAEALQRCRQQAGLEELTLLTIHDLNAATRRMG